MSRRTSSADVGFAARAAARHCARPTTDLSQLAVGAETVRTRARAWGIVLSYEASAEAKLSDAITSGRHAHLGGAIHVRCMMRRVHLQGRDPLHPGSRRRLGAATPATLEGAFGMEGSRALRLARAFLASSSHDVGRRGAPHRSIRIRGLAPHRLLRFTSARRTTSAPSAASGLPRRIHRGR